MPKIKKSKLIISFSLQNLLNDLLILLILNYANSQNPKSEESDILF